MSLHAFKLTAAIEQAKQRPDGYLLDLVEAGCIAGDEILLSDSAIAELRKRYSLSLLSVINHGISSAVRWFGAGCPTVSQDELEDRLHACAHCDEWVGGDIREGKGKCSLCGCYGLKPYLKTETCRFKPSKWVEL